MQPRRQYTVHTLDDPALVAMTATQALQYCASRDPDDLATLDGIPVTFVFRRLTRAQRALADGATTDVEKWARAFMSGILEIRGGFFAEETGHPTWAPSQVSGANYVAMSVDERDYLEEAIGPAAIADIGSVIYTRSWLRPKAVPLYPLPPMSLAAWDASHRQYVVASQAGAAQSKEPASDERG